MIYEFQQFEINTETRTFSVAGVEQKVQPKVYELLLFLLENRDRAVSKDELQDELWPNVEVTETAMTRAIMKARKLLDDKGDIIKTVHGHGYHFIAEVKTVNHSKLNLKTTTTSNKQPIYYTVVLALLLALVGVGFIYKNNFQANDDVSVAVLPIIDKTNKTDMAWVSLGLMSLATQMIGAENSIDTVSGWKTSKSDLSQVPDNLDLTDEQVSQFKTELDCNHLILAKLSSGENGMFQMEYTVYHPKGRAEFEHIKGENPTAMTQKMTQDIIASLPNSPTNVTYRVISDDVFTNELYSRGMGFQMMGDAKKARDYFKLAAEEDSSLFWPRYELALTTRKLGLAQESKDELLKLKAELADLTDDPAALIGISNALGTAEMRLGNNDLALTYYEEAYDIAELNKELSYQKLLAGNIALIYKRKTNYAKAKSWIAKSISINQQLGNTEYGYNKYLLAQIEDELGNNDASIRLLNETIAIYEAENNLRFVAAAQATKARIYKRQGLWEKSFETLLSSRRIKQDISDRLGVIASFIDEINLSIVQGKYSEAEHLIPQTQLMIDDLGNKTMNKHINRSRINLAFLKNDFTSARNLINELPIKSRNGMVNLIDIKLQYLAGQKETVDQAMAQFKEMENNINSKLYLLDMKIFMAQQSNNIQINDLLSEKIRMAQLLGHDAEAVRTMLIQAGLYAGQEKWTEVKDILNIMSLQGLDWWQVKLLDAQYQAAIGNAEAAIQLAHQAKTNSTESWSVQDLNTFDSIISCCDSPNN